MPQLARQNTHQNNAHIHRNRLQPKPATPFSHCSAMLLLLGMAWLSSCASERSAALSSRPAKLTARAADVLGFESAADWQGMQRTNAAHTQGAASGEVIVNGWTEVTSIPLSTLGVSGSEAKIDIKVPVFQQHWGEARLIVKIPSLGEWFRELGSKSLVGLLPGSFHSLTFSIPSELQDKLTDEYSDLTFTVVINATAGLYLLDNLRISTETPENGSAIDMVEESYNYKMRTPMGFPFLSYALASNTQLTIGAFSTLESSRSETTISAAMGESVPCMIDADAQVGSIVSIDKIDIGDRVNINGSLYAPSLSFGNKTFVSGNHIIDESIRVPRETNFQVVFPPAAIDSVWTEPGSVKSLSPGRYGVVRIAPNSTLHMKSGAYYFEQLNLEDSSHLVLNDSNGPIFVYAKSVTSIRCTIENERGTVPEWLLFYTGEQALNLERSFHGTLLAPKASVILHAAHHIGSFYAHALKIEANAKITHMPGLPMLIAADMDLHECMSSIPENTGQDMLAQTVLFQEEIVNYCLAPDMNKCLSSLIAKGRAERGAAVIGFIGQSRTFAEYFALAEHRFESVQMAEKDALYAAKLCAFPDSDGDWVIDAEDLCPGTPELTAVDSNGCPKAVIQESPEDEQMYRDHLGEFNFIFNERCKGIEPPGVVAPGGFFWVSQQNVV